MLKPDRIESKDARRVIGANRSYTIATRGGIPQQWAEWDYNAVAASEPVQVFGISHNFDSTGAFDYMCALQVSEDAKIPTGQSDLSIPAGSYAIFQHNGHVSGIASIFDALCKGVDLGGRWKLAFGPQLEYYTEDFDPITASGRVEIWVPLNPA